MTVMPEDFNPLGEMGYWEGAGLVTGAWLGATIMLASSPSILADSPAPGPADAAWYYANARNITYLSKQGRLAGSGLDSLLAESVAPSPDGSWGSGYVAPSTSSTKDAEFKFNKLPEGSGIKFGNFLNFGTSFLNYTPEDFAGYEFTSDQLEVITSGISMALKYVFRNSEWPQWNS